MENIKVRVLSKATLVKGQGVGSAYLEQVELIKSNPDLISVYLKKDKGRCDIYHIHTVNPTYYLRMTKKHTNIMYVHFLPETLDDSIRLPKLLLVGFKWYIRKFYKKANELVVVNPAYIEKLKNLGFDEKHITYIPNYVSKEHFYPLSEEEKAKIRDKYLIPSDKFVVLGVGQIQTRKGLDDFLTCAEKCPDKIFIWAGGFSFSHLSHGYKNLRKRVKNPPENVKFVGILDRATMNEIYNISSLLFMPSTSELFPMSILEASNVGIPILLRDLSLYKEILFDYYLKGKNVVEFCSVIDKLNSNSSYYEEARNKSIKITDFYNRDYVNNLWREYYSRLYENKGEK